MSEPVRDASLIVGIGASAGGLDALVELLAELGEASKLALVFVQHREPISDSQLPQLIASKTPMKVVELAGRKHPAGGVIYVCPPQHLVEVRRGCLRIQPNEGEAAPIDYFLHSLAAERGGTGVGIILSGSGSDGTLGLKAISDAGGLTFAQDPQTAKFDSMPRSAATTGVADHVLPPAEIASELHQYAAHMLDFGETHSLGRLQEQIRDAIPAISESLLKVTNHNFQHYKASTLSRRVQRRMQLLKIGSVEDYLGYLRRNEEETQNLFRELLIGVTTFFRDPDVFESLASNVLPKLFDSRGTDECVRIWVAGCANGAEAYSLAMLCREAMDARGPAGSKISEVRIFATDIDERALRVARAGIYPIGIEDHVSAERRQRFLVKRGKRYHVIKEIRDMVLFSAHNLISDPPFSRLDLVSCRNLLIYLGSHLQNKLIPLFHYALRPGGFLLLGPSENITSHGELFRPIDAKLRISQRKGTALGSTNSIGLRQSKASTSMSDQNQADPATDLSAMRQRIVLDEFAPKSCVIDESGQIINAAPNMQKYLSLGEGDFQNSIIKMAADGLRIGLRAAIAEAKKTRRKVQHEDMSIRDGDRIQRMMVTVQPMPKLGEDEGLFLIVFHEVGLPIVYPSDETVSDRIEEDPSREAVERNGPLVPAADTNSPPRVAAQFSPANYFADADSIIAQLERELETTRRDLDRSLQDMEAANEELKSSNEELLSMNEELQSANEELETSKEEISAGSAAVARANSDLENLLRSSQIATVFLDDDLLIRGFTPAISEIYDLIPTDIGRPLERFVPHVRNMPPLPSAKQIQEFSPLEDTIVADSGKSFIRRILPYQSYTGDYEGIVVTFLDVTELHASEERFRATFENAAVGIAHVGLDGRWLRVNDRLCEIVKYERRDSLRKTFQHVTHPDDLEQDLKLVEQLLAGEIANYALEKRYVQADGQPIWVRLTVSLLRDLANRPVHFIAIVEDVADRKQYEQELEGREQHLRRVIDNQLGFVGVLDTDGTLMEANATAIEAAGLQREDVIGRKFWDCYWWSYDEGITRQLKDAWQRAMTGELVRFDVVIRTANDSRTTIDFMLSPVRDQTGRITHLIPSAVDISERHAAEGALREREEQLRIGIEVARFGLAHIDYRDNTIHLSPEAARLYGLGDEALTVTRQRVHETFHSEDKAELEIGISNCLAGEREGLISCEHRVILPDGSVRWLDVRKQVLMDWNTTPPTPTQGILAAHDITEQKNAERRIADSKRRLTMALRAGGMAVWEWAGGQSIWEPELYELLGISPDTPASMELFYKSVHPDDLPGLQKAWEQATAGRANFDHEFRIIRPDGEIRWLCGVGEFVRDEAGKVVRLHGLNWDITPQKEMEEKLRESEIRFRGMANAAPAMIWLTNNHHRCTFLSQGWLDFTGQSEKEGLGLGWLDAIHPEDREATERIFNAAVEQRDPFEIDYRLRTADGNYRWAMDTGKPRFDARGDFAGYVGSVIDVHDRHKTEEAIKASESRIRLAAEAAGFGTVHVDLSNDCVLYSHELIRLTGASETVHAQPGPRDIPDWVHPDDRAAYHKFFEVLMTLSEDESRSLDHRILRPDGKVRWVRLQAKSLYAGRGKERKPSQLIGTVVDITAQREFEQSLERARAAAEAASESKSLFLANMSHEIRTPMTAILGYTDLIASIVDNPEAVAHIQTIRRNGAFLLDIINDILDLSKIEAGKLEISQERFSPQRLIEDVRSIMEVRAREGQLTLDVVYRGQIPKIIQTDAKRLKQILINLVGNAIKFTRHGSVRIGVQWNAGDSTMQFEITDTGIGMSQEQQEKLFQPFAQGDGNVNREFGGTGLGLAISRRLTEMLGGRIELRSQLGRGSTFTVTIATGDASHVEMVDVSGGSLAAAEANLSDVQLDCRILVVDDRRDIRFLSKRFLTAAGATVDEAEDGQLAVQTTAESMARGQVPDLILLDMQMPRLDGYQTAIALRNLGYTGPIIALTADAMQGDMSRCIESGCDDYLSKPIDKQALLEKVRQYLRP